MVKLQNAVSTKQERGIIGLKYNLPEVLIYFLTIKRGEKTDMVRQVLLIIVIIKFTLCV